MITICCALYPEARELIRGLQLKKENGDKRFPVFADGEGRVRLVVTGGGAIAAATAVAELSVSTPPGKQDYLINFGSCASAGWELGTLCLCGKLTDASTGKCYYPDMLLRHPFEEAELVTVARGVTEDACGKIRAGAPSRDISGNGCLYDREAAAAYQAGNYYYGPHQMLFLKVVTDRGVNGNGHSEADKLQGYMDEASRWVMPFLEQLLAAEAEDAERESALRRLAQEDTVRLGELFRCTAAMRAELEQTLYYRLLTGCDYEGWVQEGLRAGWLPARDKREGKRLMERFQQFAS